MGSARARQAAAAPLLSLSKVSKFFAGVRALDGVSFEARAGEVHALVGENGAGKSTLMGIASGALLPDQGRVLVAGCEASGDPQRARDLGLAIVRQEPALMPDLSVTENLYLGVPRRHRPPIEHATAWARALLHTWSADVAIEVGDRVAMLGPEQRFIVEIVKALAAQPRVLVLDEPTEHLRAGDVDRLFDRIRAVTQRGAAVVYISHRIREVQQVADRLTVLRDGRGQGTYEAHALSEQRIVELIVGGELDREFPAKHKPAAGAACVLEVENLRGEKFQDVSLQVRSGEIVGLAGISDNGQRDFLRALAGMEPGRGRVNLHGRSISPSSAQAAAQAGIRYLPGDRQREGIFAELSVRENFSVRSLCAVPGLRLLGGRSEAERVRSAVREFSVKTPSIETPVRALSGGNQQKLVLASVLASRPHVLLVDEPTQGVDVGARMEIYRLLRQVAAAGVAVIVLSSDAQEVAGLCDRVLIFSRGQVASTLAGTKVSEEGITSEVLTATTVRSRERRHGIPGFWRWAAGDAAPIAMLLIVIAALGLVAISANGSYLSPRNLSGTLALVSTLALVAFGQQLLMLVGCIDLSVGPLMGLLVVVQSFFQLSGISPALQVLGWGVAVALAIAVGVMNWVLVDPLGLHPMVATLATYMGLQAISLVLRPSPGGLIADPVLEGIATQVGFVPLAFVAAMALGLLLEYGLYRSSHGIALRGLGSRAEAARTAGIPPRASRLAAYVGCALFACLASVPLLAQVGTGDANSGTSYTLASIAAVVIGGASLFGGRGSFVGALLGAVLITQVNVVTGFLGVSDAWQSYLLGGMILASVALYSRSRFMAVAK